MTDDLDEPIETKKQKKVSIIDKSKSGIYDWFVAKGWIYLMVFIMGILLGGLIWK